MKKILFSLLIFMISCQNNDLESKKKKLDNLKNSLVETYSEIEKLEKEITLLDSNFIQKNYELITVAKLNNKPFVHEIELRGNIESRKNVVIVTEVAGKYLSVNVSEGQFVKPAINNTTLLLINEQVITIDNFSEYILKNQLITYKFLNIKNIFKRRIQGN